MRIPGGNCIFFRLGLEEDENSYALFESGAGDFDKEEFNWSFSHWGQSND